MLSAAQFVMVLDTTVMNVSMSLLVASLMVFVALVASRKLPGEPLAPAAEPAEAPAAAAASA